MSSTIINQIMSALWGRPRGHTGLYLMLTSAMFGLIGVVFLALAADRFFERTYDADIAAAATAGLLFAAATITLITRHFVKDEKIGSSAPAGASADPKVLVKNLCDGLEEPIRDNPKLALALSVLAGFVSAQHRPG